MYARFVIIIKLPHKRAGKSGSFGSNYRELIELHNEDQPVAVLLTFVATLFTAQNEPQMQKERRS